MKSLHDDPASGNGLLQAVPSLRVKLVGAAERERFDRWLAERHYLGAAPCIGDFLRQVVEREGQWVALLVWGPAALKLKDREKWIGWNGALAAGRLKLIVQNRRYLLLHEKGQEPNLASQALAAACRVLPAQWQEQFGYTPLLAESFTDPESYRGTCYKAGGWEPVGMSAGNSRHRVDYFVPNGRPKRLWMKELCPQARQKACAVPLAPEQAGALVEAAHGVLPLDQWQRRNLREVLRRAPDPRGKNTRFRIGPVLSLVAMALLCGARQISEIARFAHRLHPRQRAELGLPIKKGTRRFYEVPTYSVFYEVLTRMDPEPFAALLSEWLGEVAGTLPGALALDGKMIRDIIGMVSLVDVEDGSPVAMAVMDQKEDTERCELKSAQQLLAALPTLEGKTVTADPLHCQKETARLIAEKGGDYFLQIKGNQPTLLAYARTQAGGSPLLSRPPAGTGGLKSAP
ncbi:MAG: ISAs1 family transposase [Chthoniobacterales bacterium]|nr:ISAs1 family transposase [Chthoniobacterales bacterium]